jgi:hypothetical protein
MSTGRSEDPSKRKKRGRATLVTSELKERICAMLERGHTVKTTVAACGISERCYFDHTRKDVAFSAAALRARATGRMRIVESILDSGDWKALSWYLSVTDPEQFARTSERQIVVQLPAVRDDAADYGTTAATLRIMLAGAQDETKREALRLVLSEAEAENGKLSQLIEHWREQGLL